MACHLPPQIVRPLRCCLALPGRGLPNPGPAEVLNREPCLGGPSCVLQGISGDPGLHPLDASVDVTRRVSRHHRVPGRARPPSVRSPR